jgi:Transposase DDE domain group 1
VELLRCGSTASVLGHRVMAASTVGTWLRSFTFGHVRQLDRLTEAILGRAWAAGTGPGDGPLVVDVDSTSCEVCGHHQQGAGDGSTHTLGDHPLLATRADTGEALHARLRNGAANTAHGIARFIDELVARLRRAGASGELTLRMDSGFWSAKLIKAAARPPGALLDHGPPDQGGPRRHRRHSPSGLGPDRLPTRWGRAGRRDSLSERPADRASRPHDRPPRWVGERLSGPWPPASPSRGAGPAPPGPSVIPSLVRRARLPGRPGVGGVAA